MADTYINNGNYSAWNSSLWNLYWDEYLDDGFLGQNPLFELMVKAGKAESTPTRQVQWSYFKERNRSVTGVDMASAAAGSAANLTIGSGEGEQIAKGNVLYDSSTGSSYYVVGVSSRTSDIVSVVKIDEDNSGTTAAITADETNGHTLYVDGLVIPDAWGDIANITNYISTKQNENSANYCQDFTQYTYLTELAANERRYVQGNKRDEEFNRAVQRMMRQIEISLFRGNGGTYNTYSWSGNEGDSNVDFMKGLDGFDINSETGTIGSYTWRDFRNFINDQVLDWNDKTVYNAFCNNQFLNQVDEWVEETSEVNWAGNDTSGSAYGWNVRTLKTSLATINLWQNVALRDAFPRTDAVLYVVDLDRLKIRYLAGDEDFHMKVERDPERRFKDHRRYIVDEISCKLTLQVQNPKFAAMKLYLNG